MKRFSITHFFGVNLIFVFYDTGLILTVKVTNRNIMRTVVDLMGSDWSRGLNAICRSRWDRRCFITLYGRSAPEKRLSSGKSSPVLNISVKKYSKEERVWVSSTRQRIHLYLVRVIAFWTLDALERRAYPPGCYVQAMSSWRSLIVF